jgi:peroxiredoxin
MFPQLTLNIPAGQAIEVPGWFAGEFGVVLFNRGAWCPYCTAQLRAFQRAGDSLAQAGIRVAALWVDDEKTTAEFTARRGLTFPLGHSADARAVAGLTGAFVNDDPLFLQSAGFVLDPQGEVVVSVYSSGAIAVSAAGPHAGQTAAARRHHGWLADVHLRGRVPSGSRGP